MIAAIPSRRGALEVVTPPDRPPDDEDAGGTGPNTLPSELGRYAGHGMTIALSTAAFAWGGVWLDDRLGTEPVFVLVGVFVGFGAGFYSMYRDIAPGAGTAGGSGDDGPPGDDPGDGRRAGPS